MNKYITKYHIPIVLLLGILGLIFGLMQAVTLMWLTIAICVAYAFAWLIGYLIYLRLRSRR